MSSPNVQDIFRAVFPSFQSERPLSHRVQVAGESICSCKSGAYGSFIAKCPDGHFARELPKSCWHRSCPMCRFNGTERWIEGWRSRILDVGHHHCVFTLPEELRRLWRYNDTAMPDIAFAAVAHTFKTLLGEDEYCGALPGGMMALHTWGQTLQFHPHIHAVVTAGGLHGEDWVEAKKPFLLPIKQVQSFYRGAFLRRLRKRYTSGLIRLPPELTEEAFLKLMKDLWKKSWHVEMMERYEHANGVLEYLARYVKGGPIGNSRIEDFDGSDVTFRYVDNREKKTSEPPEKTMSLGAFEFVKRYLTHVPAPGYRTVRGFGLYANCQRNRKLAVARAALGQKPPEPPRKPSLHRFLEKKGIADRAACPTCGKPLVYVYEHSIRRRARPPPEPVREKLVA